jgi:hypothetical protein
VGLALGLLLENTGSILLGETATDGAGLLWAEVERQVLLLLVEEAELGALVGVDDGQDLGDRLADVVAVDGRQVSYAVPLTSNRVRATARSIQFGDS